MSYHRRSNRFPIPLVWAVVAIGVAPAILAGNSAVTPQAASAASPAAVFAMEVDTNRADGSNLSQGSCLQAAVLAATNAGYARVSTSGGQVAASSLSGGQDLTISCPAAGDATFPYAMVSLSDSTWKKSQAERDADHGLQTIVASLHQSLARE